MRQVACGGVKRGLECFPALNVESKTTPIGERLFRPSQGAFKHEVAHGPMGGGGVEG